MSYKSIKKNLSLVQKNSNFISIFLFIFTFIVYTLTISGHQYSVDGIAMYQQAKRLLFHHTLAFNPPFRWGDYSAQYTYWPEGLSIAYMPALIIAYILSPNKTIFLLTPQTGNDLLFDPSYKYISVFHIIISSLSILILFKTLLSFNINTNLSIIISIITAFCTPLFSYHKQDFSQLILLYITIHIIYVTNKSYNINKKNTFILGLLLGFSIITRTESIITIVLPTIIFLFFSNRNMHIKKAIPRIFILLSLILFFITIHISINYIKSGRILGDQAGNSPFTFSFLTVVFLFGHIFSPSRGILFFLPFSVFTPIGLYRMWKSPFKIFSVYFSIIIIFNLIIYSSWIIWWGGISWGPRFFVPIIPILTITAFWPKKSYTKKYHYYIEMTAKFIFSIFGLALSLCGSLLDWFRFESMINIKANPQNLYETSMIFFDIKTNMLVSHFQDIFDPGKYDILWLEKSEIRDLFPYTSTALILTLLLILASILKQNTQKTTIYTQQ